LLAKVINDDAGSLDARDALTFLASKSAPTLQTSQRLRRIDRSTAFTSLVIAPMEM
jgi:hypothetical protein